MGFWNKLGKIALQAAPYVAAPFTGGASLMATGLTNQLGQKWAEHDARENAKKGLGPSSFDKWLGITSGAAGLASSLTGGFGGALSGASKAGQAANTASRVSGFANTLGRINTGINAVQGIGGLISQARSGGSDPSSSQNGVPAGSNMAVPRSDNAGSSMAAALAAGKNEALRNQPWRAGYDVVSPGAKEGDPEVRTTMPPIYPQYEAPQTQPSSFQQNLVSPPIDESTPRRRYDNLTPRRARQRNPEPVVE